MYSIPRVKISVARASHLGIPSGWKADPGFKGQTGTIEDPDGASMECRRRQEPVRGRVLLPCPDRGRLEAQRCSLRRRFLDWHPNG